MLTSLRVTNLAIVEDVRVEFGPGLNIITGETGAGKSIVVGALGLILGERADKSLLRAGTDRCTLEAVFELAEPGPVNATLADLGIEPCEAGRLVIRRIVTPTGGRNLINDCEATVQGLRTLGNLLVDMHGPHDHQSLLQPEFQRDILDAFGHHAKELAAYGRDYAALRELEARRQALEGDDQALAQQLDMLSFQVKELEEADLADLDEDELRREHGVQAHAQRILELAGALQSMLTEDEAAAFNTLVRAQEALTELAGILPEAADWGEEARALNARLQELAETIARRVRDMEADPDRLGVLEARLALLQRLKRKYGPTVPAMREFLARAQERLTDLGSRGERLKTIEADLVKVRAALKKTGGALHDKRQAAATKLAKAVTQQLRDLGFPHGAFAVELAAAEPGPSGLDAIDFGFAPNAGEPMRSLRAIASSGEISRVMLATKAVLSDHDRIPVLIFDEIDANLGGEMGSAVGRKLAGVAGCHQVLCITHLPQVAVFGTRHHAVTKDVRGGRTRTQVDLLDTDARAGEIARMLGGRDTTSVVLQHAREMLAAARKQA